MGVLDKKNLGAGLTFGVAYRTVTINELRGTGPRAIRALKCQPMPFLVRSNKIGLSGSASILLMTTCGAPASKCEIKFF